MKPRLIASALFLGLILFISLFYALVYQTDEAVTSANDENVLHTAPLPPKVYTIDAGDVEAAINNERALAGLPVLQTNELLRRSACLKANHMVDNNYWGHIAPDGTTPWYFYNTAGYLYSGAGENLAYNFTNVKSVIISWMKSPSHKENIVGNYSEQGVCVLNNVAYQGGVYILIVSHFGTPK